MDLEREWENYADEKYLKEEEKKKDQDYPLRKEAFNEQDIKSWTIKKKFSVSKSISPGEIIGYKKNGSLL